MSIFIVHLHNSYLDGSSSSYIQNSYRNEIDAYIEAVLYNLVNKENMSKITTIELEKTNMQVLNEILEDFVNLTTESNIVTIKDNFRKLSIESLKQIHNWLFLFNSSRSSYSDVSVAEVSECELK